MRRGIVISVVPLIAFCCVAFAVGGLAYLLWPRPVAKPVVLINSPGHGEQVDVGERVTVQAIARGRARVTRIELWVDGELQESQRSTLPGGISPFPLVTHWEPLSTGSQTLSVRAFNAQDGRAHASVTVQVGELADRDEDGVADDDDLCPDEPGWEGSNGCPDGDGDGTPDAEDPCPEQAGPLDADGCRAPGEGDRDGDGLPDEDDACPDAYGPPVAEGCPDADWDGVTDSQDACPDQRGLPEHDGCPLPGDLDGDGVLDRQDDCPAERGLPDLDGCPDRDGDSVADHRDLRPDEPGSPERDGAPDTGAPDSDGDGRPDDIDHCDDHVGLPEHDGCPPPGGADEPPEGPLEFLYGLIGPAIRPAPGPAPGDLAIVEVEAQEFLLGQQYDEVTCYVGVGDWLGEYGPFPLEGGTRWDIAAALAGDNREVVAAVEGEPLEVFMECEAYVGEEPPINLGTLRQEHPPEEWDGRRLGGRSVRETEPFGLTFLVSYRLCLNSCETSPFPAPIAQLAEALGDTRLWWQWEGDEQSIDEFRVNWSCGSGRGATLRAAKDRRSLSVQFVEPSPGTACEFYVYAYRMDGVRSPPSNIAVWEGKPWWEGEPWRQYVYIILDEVDIGTSHGPIYGEFWVNDQVREFNGAVELWFGEWGGYTPPPGEPGFPGEWGLTCREIASGISRNLDWCESCFQVPSCDAFHVTLGEGEGLSYGVNVIEIRDGDEYERCRVTGGFHQDEIPLAVERRNFREHWRSQLCVVRGRITLWVPPSPL